MENESSKNFLFFGVISIAIILMVVGFVLSNNELKDRQSPQATQPGELTNVVESSGSGKKNSPVTGDATMEESEESMEEQRRTKQYNNQPKMILSDEFDYQAIIKTNKGDIRIDLYEDKVPITVNNFVFLASEGFYDQVIFHRIIKDFMIQSGDPTGTGMGHPGYKFEDEPFTGEYTAGTIAMANSGPDTNGSQFFIMHKDYALPPNYVIFGKAMDAESLAIVDTIANTPVETSPSGESSKPAEKIVINSVEIIEAPKSQATE